MNTVTYFSQYAYEHDHGMSRRARKHAIAQRTRSELERRRRMQREESGQWAARWRFTKGGAIWEASRKRIGQPLPPDVMISCVSEWV